MDYNQVPLSMEFPRQEYWSGLPFHSPGYLPNPGFKSMFAALAGRVFTTESLLLKAQMLGFPGGAVVKILSSQCKGPGFSPWSRN